MPATPGFIVATGSSRSGKGSLPILAAGVYGGKTSYPNLHEDTDKTLQEMADAVAGDTIGICLDEIGKDRGSFFRKSAPVLRMGSSFQAARKYDTLRTYLLKSPVIITDTTLPSGLTTMPEMQNRAVGFELGMIPEEDWWSTASTIGLMGSLRSSGNGAGMLLAESLYMWVQMQLQKLGEDLYDGWRDVAKEYGAHDISELGSEADQARTDWEECKQDIYALYACAEDSMFNKHGFLKGDCYPIAEIAQRILSPKDVNNSTVLKAISQELKTHKPILGAELGFTGEDANSEFVVRLDQRAPAQWTVYRLRRRANGNPITPIGTTCFRDRGTLPQPPRIERIASELLSQ
jgi:hypothetical protein